MEYRTIAIDSTESGVFTLTLNRPEKKNAMNPTLHREMQQVLTELAVDRSVPRVGGDGGGGLVLCGDGSQGVLLRVQG
jgi:trans-feruloyl-CoA hydratase/vanillin synthase